MRVRALGLSRLLAAAAAAALLLLAAPTFAQTPSAEDLLVGTWVLDVPASRYHPGPPLRAETRVYTREPEGVKGVIKRTYADGREETIEYMANADREYMVTGTPAYDSVLLRQINAHTSEARLSHGGTVFGVAVRVISHDGKSMTITFRRPDADALNIAVYRKQ